MTKIKALLAKYSISTHSVAGAFVLAALAYKEVPQFHSLVLATYDDLPGKLQAILATGLALYTWYRNGEKNQ